MIYGIGTDILKIETISNCVVYGPLDSFVRKTYTDREISLILTRPLPLNSYATRFCGKEAVFKALNLSGDQIRLNEIEILEHENSQPFVILHENAKRLADEKGIKNIHISLSYDSKYALAFVTAEC